MEFVNVSDGLQKMEWQRIVLVIPSFHVGGMDRVMSELADYFCSKEEFKIKWAFNGIRFKVIYLTLLILRYLVSYL